LGRDDARRVSSHGQAMYPSPGIRLTAAAFRNTVVLEMQIRVHHRHHHHHHVTSVPAHYCSRDTQK
jgi:hypothetical protein